MRNLLILLFILIVTVCAAGYGLTYRRWESQPPAITLDRDFKALGRAPVLSLKVDDAGTGLKQITIKLKQKDQESVLADDSFDRTGAPASKTYDIGNLIQTKSKIEEGPATLTVSAR